MIRKIGFLLIVLSTVIINCTSKGSNDIIMADGYNTGKIQLHNYIVHSNRYRNNSEPITLIGGDSLFVIINNQDTQPLPDDTLFLMDNDNKILLTVPIIKYSNTRYYTMIPIPYYLKEGTYTIGIEENGSDIRNNNVFSIYVGNRNFAIEQVALNHQLADSKTREADLRVVSEAEEIWRVTGALQPNILGIDNFVFPLDKYKYVTGMFADQRAYTYEGKPISHVAHKGIDIAAPVGTPIQSTADGVVVLAKDRVVTGNSVVISHFPGVYSMFYHLEDIYVNIGDILSKGDILGTVGSTGFSTGPHLHWEMRVHNIQVDPIFFMDALDKIYTFDIK